MGLYSVKTTANREESCADAMAGKFEGINSILCPEEMTGYMIVEANDIETAERAVQDVPHANKVLEGEVSMSEIDNFFEESNAVEDIEENYIVEILDDSFKGDTARVVQVNSSKEKVKVELLEAEVPIPIELRGDQVRIIDKDPE